MYVDCKNFCGRHIHYIFLISLKLLTRIKQINSTILATNSLNSADVTLSNKQIKLAFYRIGLHIYIFITRYVNRMHFFFVICI